MRQKLQRHSSSQPRVLGLVHHSHAAATPLLHNFVMGYRLTNHRASTLRAVILGAPSLPSQLHVPHVSKLFRNVPFLTSIEMSPFFVLYLFLLLSTLALEKFFASKPQERRSSTRSNYGIPVFLSCWLGWSSRCLCEPKLRLAVSVTVETVKPSRQTRTWLDPKVLGVGRRGLCCRFMVASKRL